MYWSLLLGGGIAILSAALTSLINHRYLLKQLEKKREWDLEDERKIIKKEIINNRLDDLESYIQNMIKTSSLYEFRFIVQDQEGFDCLVDIQNADVRNEYFPNIELSYIVNYFSDTELEKYHRELIEKSSKLMVLYDEFTRSIKNNEPGSDRIRKDVVNLFLGRTYSNLLRRIDYLRETYGNI